MNTAQSSSEQTMQPSKYQRATAVFLSVLLMYITFFVVLGAISTLLQVMGVPMLIIAAFEFATLIMAYINVDTLVRWGQALAEKILAGILAVDSFFTKVKARVSSFFSKKEETAQAAAA